MGIVWQLSPPAAASSAAVSQRPCGCSGLGWARRRHSQQPIFPQHSDGEESSVGVTPPPSEDVTAFFILHIFIVVTDRVDTYSDLSDLGKLPRIGSSQDRQDAVISGLFIFW